MDSWDRELRNMDREHQMAYATQSQSTQKDNTMSDKQYVDMRVKESAKGNKYLSGKLKSTGQIFMVLKNKEGQNTLHFKENFEGDLQEIDKFTAKDGDYGPYEFAKNSNTGEAYFLTAREDAGQPVTYKKGPKAGEPVMGFDGNQLLAADFTLKIAAKRD